MNLYNKYKPKNLSEIIGQEFILKIIKALVDNPDLLVNSLVVSGAYGVGKTLLLNLLAKRLNCLNPVSSLETCNSCESCLYQQEDVIEIDAATHSGVDAMRRLIECVNYMPLTMKYKIYIIDEAHMLSQSAFDSLLLTLHELPANVKFFFATTKLHKIPPTILSRCMVLQMERIQKATLVNYVKDISQKEGKILSESITDLIVKASNGSVRQCLSTLQLSLLAGGDEAMLEKYLRVLNPEKALEIFCYILDGEPQKALESWNLYYNNGYDERFFLDELMNIVCHLTKVKMNVKSPHVYQEILERYDISIELLCNFWDILMSQMEGFNTNCKHVVDATIMMLCTVLDRSGLARILKK